MAEKNQTIRISWPLVPFVLFLTTACVAQEIPKWELFGGYSFQRSDVRKYYKSTPIIYSVRNQYANLNGWDVSATENLNRWFAGTLDLSGHYNTPRLLGIANRERMFSILYGPRFSRRRAGYTSFAHVLVGAAHADVMVTPVGPHTSDTAFAAAGGVGMDLNLGSRAAIRVFQTEYFRTNVLGTNPNGFRASAGLVFYLDRRKQ